MGGDDKLVKEFLFFIVFCFQLQKHFQSIVNGTPDLIFSFYCIQSPSTHAISFQAL